MGTTAYCARSVRLPVLCGSDLEQLFSGYVINQQRGVVDLEPLLGWWSADPVLRW